MGCATCAKVIVFVANILFALASLALMGAGVAVLLVVREEGFAGLGAEAGPAAVVAVGAVAFLVSFFGCCGVLMANQCMLFTYSILLIILMNLKTALATTIFVAQDLIKNALKSVLQQEFNSNSGSFTEVEKVLGCCGTGGAQAYEAITLPASCCAGAGACTVLNAHRGCNAALDEFVQDFGYGIAACCVLLIVIELIAVIFGLCLANNVGNKYKSRY